MKSGIKKQYHLPIAYFLAVSVVVIYWIAQVFRSPVADGFDGYYYVMQVNHLFREGAMHSSDFSLIYLPLILLGLVFPPLLSYKITVVLIGVLFTLSGYRFVRKSGSRAMALMAVFYILLSPSVLFFTLQFPKNLLGILVLLNFLSCLKGRKSRRAVLWFILLAFSHRLAFCMGLACLLFSLAVGRKILKYIIPSLFLLLIVLLIPGLLNIFDFQRIIFNDLDLFGYWGPVEFYQLWDLWRQPSWIFDFLFIHLILILSLLHFVKRKFRIPELYYLILLLVVPLWAYSSGSLSYRLSLNGFLLLPLIYFSFSDTGAEKKAMIPLLSISFLFAFFPRYDHSKFNPPIETYRDISSAINEELHGREVDLVIAHKGIKEQIILNTDLEASNWAPEEYTDSTYRVFTGISDYLLLQYLDSRELSAIISLPRGYYLVSETLFQKLIERIGVNEGPDVLRRINTWQNPLRQKPDYL